MARVNGRLLRPSTLEERRVFKRLGVEMIRVSRGHNPFAIARLLARLSKTGGMELEIIRKVLEEDRIRRPRLPVPCPLAPTPYDPASPWCPDAATA